MITVDDVTIDGDDSQNAIGNTVSGDLVQNQLTFVRNRPSMVLSESMIVGRIADYVPALNHDAIVEALQKHSAVALSGSPGAGVMTTAIAALRDLRPDLRLRYFATGEDHVEEIQAAAPHGYLMRAADERKEWLWPCLEAVHASKGFLVLVGSPHECDEFADVFDVISVRPPPADTVYRRRLRRDGLAGTQWPGWQRATELLRDALPRDGRRLADLVLAVKAKGGDEQEVEQAYQGWAAELRRWFTANPQPRDRALMVAAATITPADETTVYDAALSLARQLRIPVEGGGLAWCPTTGLVPMLGADRDESGIVFRRQGFAHSVLRHVWDEYPLTRTDLLRWLSRLATEGIGLGPKPRTRLAEVFADLAAEHGSEEAITRMAWEWSELRLGADLAYVALARTCLHPLVGRHVRRTLNKWSKDRRAPQTLKLTVARVCEVLGETHLAIAMTRLQHLATNGNEQLQDEVFTVVRALADTHPDEVFAAAMAWCRGAVNLSDSNASCRVGVAMRLLLTMLEEERTAAPTPAPSRLGEVLKIVEELAIRAGARLRLVLMANVRALAVQHPDVMINKALVWAGTVDRYAAYGVPSLAILGTDLFLEMAAGENPAGLTAVLAGPAAVIPRACVPAWSMALAAETTMPRGFAAFDAAGRLWLDTAVRRPDLRPQIVATFVDAAAGDLRRGTLIVSLTWSWAGIQADRQGVREDVFMKLLMPVWKRWLLVLWVRLRPAFGIRR